MRVIRGQPFDYEIRSKDNDDFEVAGLKRLIIFGDCVSDAFLAKIRAARKIDDPAKRLNGLNEIIPDGHWHVPRLAWKFISTTGNAQGHEKAPPVMKYIDDYARGFYHEANAEQICAVLDSLPREFPLWEKIIGLGHYDLNNFCKEQAELAAKPKAATVANPGEVPTPPAPEPEPDPDEDAIWGTPEEATPVETTAASRKKKRSKG